MNSHVFIRHFSYSKKRILFGCIIILVLIAFILLKVPFQNKERSHVLPSPRFDQSIPVSLHMSPSVISVFSSGTPVTSFSVQIFENSGSQFVNAVQANVLYPSSQFSVSSVSYTNSAFSIKAEESRGNGLIKMARGTTTPVSGDQLIATITFQINSSVQQPVNLSFTQDSTVVSSTSNTNILQTSTGSVIVNSPVSPTPTSIQPTLSPTTSITPTSAQISQTPTLTQTLSPTGSSTPIPTATLILSPTMTPTISPTPLSPPTQFMSSVTLPGIGRNVGDNSRPIIPQRNATVELDDPSTKNLVAQGTGTVIFNTASFSGTLTAPAGLVSGLYYLKVHLDNTLKKLVYRNPVFIGAGQTIPLPQVQLLPGDFDGNNTVDLADYNQLLGCFGNKLCKNKTIADFNSDGKVDEIDFNIFLRTLAIQSNGD